MLCVVWIITKCKKIQDILKIEKYRFRDMNNKKEHPYSLHEFNTVVFCSSLSEWLKYSRPISQPDSWIPQQTVGLTWDAILPNSIAAALKLYRIAFYQPYCFIGKALRDAIWPSSISALTKATGSHFSGQYCRRDKGYQIAFYPVVVLQGQRLPDRILPSSIAAGTKLFLFSPADHRPQNWSTIQLG